MVDMVYFFCVRMRGLRVVMENEKSRLKQKGREEEEGEKREIVLSDKAS